MSASLLIIQGIDQGARHELNAQEFSLGRGVQNSVRVHDTEVSRQHAVCRPLEGGGWEVVDLNSSNGTFVNGQAVSRHRLVNGDQVQVGRTVLLYIEPKSSEESQLRIDQVSFGAEPDPNDRQNIVSEARLDNSDSLLGLTDRAAVEQTLAQLQVIYRITEETVRPSSSLEQVLDRILALSIEATGADRGCVLLKNPQTGDLAPSVFRDRQSGNRGDKMPVSRTIVDYVVQNGQGVRTSDAQTDQRFTPGQSILAGGIREAICVPMQGRHELLGAIYIDITTSPEKVLLGRAPAGKFHEDLLRLMVAVGRQAALAVEDNRYEQAFVKAERLAAVGQTIAILSHHIKNVLQGIRGGSYLIEMGLRDHNEDLIKKGWGIVDKNQGKIYHLVMDMLTYSKDRQPALALHDVNATVSDVCELMQARAKELGVTLAVKLAADMPQTCYDAEGIHRALLNIVTNALDAVEGVPEGTVRVQSGHDPETHSVFVAVSDNGPGIPANRLPHIFNLFESTKGSRGTGIGLAVSQKILREHGGEIVVSSPPGQGAFFTLEWPLQDEEASNPTLESDTIDTLGGEVELDDDSP